MLTLTETPSELITSCPGTDANLGRISTLLTVVLGVKIQNWPGSRMPTKRPRTYLRPRSYSKMVSFLNNTWNLLKSVRHHKGFSLKGSRTGSGGLSPQGSRSAG